MKNNVYVVNNVIVDGISKDFKTKMRESAVFAEKRSMEQIQPCKEFYNIQFDKLIYEDLKKELDRYENVFLVFDVAKNRSLFDRITEDKDNDVYIESNLAVETLFGDMISYKVMNAESSEFTAPDFQSVNLIKNVSSMNISYVKTNLLKYFYEKIEIYVINNGKAEKITLRDLSTNEEDDCSILLLVPKYDFLSVKGDFKSFMELIAYLRSDKGCPWDRKQTHKSLKKHLLEETYEVLDVIDKEDMNGLCDELGDLLLQIALHGQIAKEKGFFDEDDIIYNISNKLIRRHPYVFADVHLEGDDTSKVWNDVKKEEKSFKNYTQSLKDVPKGFPALVYAQKIQKRAADANFDFENYEQALSKVYEEIEELKAEIENNDSEALIIEGGDLLFSTVNVLRLLGVDCEDALRLSSSKFVERFSMMESIIEKDNNDIVTLKGDFWEKYWEKAKLLLK
ncbi:nucleoside triphosphate pyrophosphohydrolase [Anaerofustis sp.]|uniref:nucleoside triphosphate pyrophosphohydrolase n=1 Tax=Anaerofustis sp. TaxID=1872517 RepID=UPI0025C125E2|nr:nucleoside triphosphate pyrophosphohydrolase [Anaerofustis sp.]